MQVAVRTIRVVRTESTEKEWETLRQLVAEGLTVVDHITPDMAAVAASLGLRVQDAPAEATPSPAPTPRKPRTKSGKRPASMAPAPEEG